MNFSLLSLLSVHPPTHSTVTVPKGMNAGGAGDGGAVMRTDEEDKGTIGLIVIVSLIIVSLIIAPVSTESSAATFHDVVCCQGSSWGGRTKSAKRCKVLWRGK